VPNSDHLAYLHIVEHFKGDGIARFGVRAGNVLTQTQANRCALGQSHGLSVVNVASVSVTIAKMEPSVKLLSVANSPVL
jgi:hypothetical protein